MQSIGFYLWNRNILATGVLLRLNKIVPEKLYLKWLFRLNVGYKLNLKNPKTFNEKLQWLKLYDRKLEYTSLVDKYEVKRIVGKKIGEEHIIPTLGVWNNVDDIEWDTLPNQFVLKTTHGSGGSGVVICKDKNSFDIEDAKRKLDRSLAHSDTYAHYREWPYKNIKRRIIAEKFLTNDNEDLDDYKMHCLNGVPKVILVCRDRYKNELSEDFYTTEWEHLDLKHSSHDNALQLISRPAELKEMLDISEKLSEKMTFARTDFYSVHGKVFFCEIKLYPASGLVPFVPGKYDELFSDWTVSPDIEIVGKYLIIRKRNIFIVLYEYDSAALNDYKFFCFDGKVKFFKVDFGRFKEHHANYYDPDGTILPFGEEVCLPVPGYKITLPSCLEQMKAMASTISKGFPFLRVDLYVSGGQIYFGETTFYPASGMGRFSPESADLDIGNMLNLPIK
jgi:hypothetical protein